MGFFEPQLTEKEIRDRIAALVREAEAGRLVAADDREAILLRMGYRSYANYRSRTLWKRIRKRVLERDNRTCFRCKGAASVVHHRSYAEPVLRGEDDSQLVSLCDGCHEVVEFVEEGRRRVADDEERVLHEKDEGRDYPKPKIDLRLKRAPVPPEWNRMNANQRCGWWNEYIWFWTTRKFPHFKEKRPGEWASMQAAYEETKRFCRKDE